jgi:hypothetical protein
LHALVGNDQHLRARRDVRHLKIVGNDQQTGRGAQHHDLCVSLRTCGVMIHFIDIKSIKWSEFRAIRTALTCHFDQKWRNP